jgi:hypothetical protein
VAAAGWLVALAFLSLLPALRHGFALGSYDILGTGGLLAHPGAQVHNGLSGDQIQEMIPWTVLDWRAVHAGHLPLWNPYNGMGLPLAFNFQSASFSLPTLVSYAVPLRDAYTVTVLVKLVIAGTGAYAAGRVLGLGRPGALMAGTTFELSGALTAWAGWPMSGVLCWLGWALALAALVLQGRRRPLPAVGLAVVGALAVYGGHPESVVLLGGSLAVLAGVLLVARGRDGGWHWDTTGRPLVDLAVAAAGAAALAAPLLLPGIQLGSASARNVPIGYRAEEPRNLVNLLTGGWNGYPTAGHVATGRLNYYEAASYVGVIVLVLALVAVVRLRRAVAAPALLAGLILLVLFVPPVGWVMGHAPLTSVVEWTRLAIPLDFALALLGGAGLSLVWREGTHPPVFAALAGSTLALALAVLLAWLLRSGPGHGGRAAQTGALAWPLGGVASCALAAGLLAAAWYRTVEAPSMVRRMPRLAAGGLVAVETLFLLTATPVLWSSTSGFLPTSAAERAVAAKVGSARLGFVRCPAPDALPVDLGVLSEANAAYGLDEVTAYDPILPRSYFTAQTRVSGRPARADRSGNFCPSLDSVALARAYGARYLLTSLAGPVPAGTRLVGVYGDEVLLRVPDSGVVTSQPLAGGRATVLPVTSSAPGQLRAVTHGATPQLVRLRISDLPGVRVSVDGRPATTGPYDGAMLQVEVPAGRHQVAVTYRPTAFVVGVVLAVLAAVALVVWAVVVTRRRPRHHRPRGTPRADPAPGPPPPPDRMPPGTASDLSAPEFPVGPGASGPPSLSPTPPASG